MSAQDVERRADQGDREPKTLFPHAGWCNDHRTWVDPISHRDVTEVCRRVVTVGEVTVELEVSPSWTEPADLPIVMPDWTACDQAGARDLAAALIEAARILAEES